MIICSYPIFLRWILYTIRLILPRGEYFHYSRETLTFLLDHPRRCYTTLFPSAHTWWLLVSVIVLNGADWVAYEVLNVSLTIPRRFKFVTLIVIHSTIIRPSMSLLQGRACWMGYSKHFAFEVEASISLTSPPSK